MSDQANEIVLDPKSAIAGLKINLASWKYCFENTVNIENSKITKNEKNSFSSCLKLYHDLLQFK